MGRPEWPDWSAEAYAVLVGLGGAAVMAFDAVGRALAALGSEQSVSASQQWVGVLVVALLVYGWQSQRRYRRLASWPDGRARKLGELHQEGIDVSVELAKASEDFAPIEGTGAISVNPQHPSVTRAWDWECRAYSWLATETAEFGFAPMFRTQPGGIPAGPDYHVAKARQMVNARVERMVEIQALLLAHRRPSRDS